LVLVIDYMFNQHAKWLSISNDLSWREGISSLNLLITSTVWRQDQLFLTSTATLAGSGRTRKKNTVISRPIAATTHTSTASTIRR